ncbi:hypothetical protein JCGZ_18609 [Jatropha curcas]|uniref:Uncharacterized protein n=1 Tax=Jatropha curcas TaxID=180498 RepID=A0A067K4P6_JATCU|nr:hypothetical protein JCGZ_18609 [Jatropha curcas]
MKMVVRHGDTYRLARVDEQSEGDDMDEEDEIGAEGYAKEANIGGLPPTFILCLSGPSHSAAQVETDEVLACILSRMDMFDNRME